MLRADGEENEELETQTFTLTIMRSHWTAEVDQEFKRGLVDLFDVLRVAYCQNCGLLFAPVDNDRNCVVTHHSGHQLPFPSGEFEEVEMDDDNNEPITIVKWSCCGEVAKDEPGCQSRVMDGHVIDQKRTDAYCRYTVQEAPLYSH
jgi:hypothetical protein